MSEGIEEYTKIIDSEEASEIEKARAYFKRGEFKLELRQYEDAIEDFDKSIALNPDYAFVYYMRGIAKDLLGKHEEAISDYMKAIEKDTGFKSLYYNIANSKLKLERYDEAIEYYAKAIEQYNKAGNTEGEAGAYYNRASAQTTLGKHEEAIADYTKAIEIDPNDVGAYYNRGIAKLKLKNYKEAIDDLNRALQNGIPDKYIQKNKPDIKKNSIEDLIFSVFQSVKDILNTLKVQKNEKDKIQYLSHTTPLSVFIRHLFPIENKEEQESKEKEKKQKLKKLRLHHIAYANDPTEGRLLFDVLGITKEHTGTIPYVMVASFCGGEKPETLDRLPIWNLYGDDAQGISLIFQKNDLASGEPGHATSLSEALPKIEPPYDDKQGHVVPSAKAQPNKGLVPMLYKVYYTNKDGTCSTDIKDKETIDEHIETIKKSLKKIEEKDKESQVIHTKTLELLTGLSYLVKNESYQYENEYRLLRFATRDDIAETLKLEKPKPSGHEEPKTLEHKEPKTNEQDNMLRVYMDTDILEKLHCVMTAPKIDLPQAVEIQYRLDAYRKQFMPCETPKVRRSTIPYR